jgi:hypothetical protein
MYMYIYIYTYIHTYVHTGEGGRDDRDTVLNMAAIDAASQGLPHEKLPQR